MEVRIDKFFVKIILDSLDSAIDSMRFGGQTKNRLG